MFESYNAFKTGVADWLADSSLEPMVGSFITLAEAELNRELSLFSMETVEYIDTVANNAYLEYPTRYKSLRWLRLDRTGADPIDFISSEQFTSNPQLFNAGIPDKYTLHGDRIQLGPIPNAVLRIEAGVVAKFEVLSGSNTSNWWLANAPDLLLYSTLKHAEPYLKNDERVATWKVMREDAKLAVLEQDHTQRFPVGGGLTMRSVKGRNAR